MPGFSPQVADFSLPASAEEVAVILSAPVALFGELISPERKGEHYEQRRIPKRRPTATRRFRDVWLCRTDEVATIHKTLARRLALFVQSQRAFPHPIAHGYVSGRSAVTNARVHAGAYVLLKVDIEGFFSAIAQARIEEVLRSLGLQAGAAGALAELSTIDGRLPLGLHASPMLANLVCLRLDEKLAALSDRCGCRVSRYGDDIAFSGDSVPALDEVAELLRQEDFVPARAKCRTTRRGQAHYITGLSISDARPRVPKRMKRRLRQELHFVRKFGLLGHLAVRGDSDRQAAVNRIDGTIRYVNAAEPELAAALFQDWRSLLQAEGLTPAYAPRQGPRTPVTLVVDETEIETPNGPVLAIGIVVFSERDYIQRELDQLLRSHLVDPYATGDKSVLQNRGLHCAEVSEDLRTAVFKKLEHLPIRAYVAYGPLHGPEAYESTYVELVRGLLQHRLMYCDGAEVEVVFEVNDKVSLQSLQELVASEFNLLLSRNDRRPVATPLVRRGTKLGEPSMALADFLLAAFRQYAVLETAKENTRGMRPPGELASKRFERLRDRIRFILELPSRQSFSRRRPFFPWAAGSPSHHTRAAELGH